MVVRHLVSPTHAPRPLESAAQIFFSATGRGCEVAHSGGTEALRPAEKWRYQLPSRLILGRELDLVRRKSDERAVQNELAGARKLFQSDVERRLWQFRLQ